MVAADLLSATHPLHKSFIAWLKGKEPTKRQARRFLAQFPRFRQAQQG